MLRAYAIWSQAEEFCVTYLVQANQAKQSYKLEVKMIGERNKICVEVYTDADGAGENTDRKSVNAALAYMNEMLVPWQCNKQPLVSLSTMESEFASASRGMQEAMGCYHMVKELKQPIELSIQSRMDNQAAIATIMNEASSSKTKHVDIKHQVYPRTLSFKTCPT